MHPLDIISASPNLYILHQKSNKTNFGGVLFLIYLVLVILIIVYYILDYKDTPEFSIQSLVHFNIKSDEENAERKKNILYNPNINFTIDLSMKRDESFLSNKFKLFDLKLNKYIDRNKTFNRQIDDFDIFIIYELNNSNFSEYDEFLKNFNEDNDTSFYLNLKYSGFRLDHQNKNQPIIRNEQGKDIIFTRYYKLDLNLSKEIINEWSNIIYTEKKGFLSNDTKDGCGYIDYYNSFSHDKILLVDFSVDHNKRHVFLGRINFDINNTQYIEYFRKRFSELDFVANILALVANLFTGVRFILSFYSDNFNNFKIIENILNRNLIKKDKTKKPLEIDFIENNGFKSINDDYSEKNTNKNNDNYDEENIIQDNINEELCDELEGEDNDSSKTTRIKKLRFFDFFLNNIYCCCKKQKPQKIIHMCNEIVYKYASIYALIKNQILIENFFKDYKWNDPSLYNLENNELFIKLKTYL